MGRWGAWFIHTPITNFNILLPEKGTSYQEGMDALVYNLVFSLSFTNLIIFSKYFKPIFSHDMFPNLHMKDIFRKFIIAPER